MTLDPIVVAPAASFITIFLLAMSIFQPRKNEARDKLARYAYKSAQDPDNLSRPFTERIVVPILERFGRLAGSAAPKQMQDRIQEALDEAGNPMSVHSYLALRALATGGLPLLYLLGAFAGGPPTLSQLFVAGIIGYGGFFLSRKWLTGKAEARRKAIERALPDALDLIVVSMEAGLALDGAIAKVVEKAKGAFKEEFQRMLHEIQLGKPRRDALRQLAQRCKVKDLITVVNAVVQADQMGVSMAQVMRTQADEARLKRRQRAEEKAHKAAVKMLFPLILFILPAVMIVTVGPAALSIFHNFNGGLFG
jgi:tight adherence protein C